MISLENRRSLAHDIFIASIAGARLKHACETAGSVNPAKLERIHRIAGRQWHTRRLTSNTEPRAAGE